MVESELERAGRYSGISTLLYAPDSKMVELLDFVRYGTEQSVAVGEFQGMIAPEIPHNEAARLDTLRALKNLDTSSEERFTTFVFAQGVVNSDHAATPGMEQFLAQADRLMYQQKPKLEIPR